ncbi:hypothetical protein E7V67_013275 [[Empedobacter] haloabium]|uniref:Uncharacterized protein n=1 Tax=[Empedobacter] haloabium TaxID=592317 RepID=A0ABZ1UTD5_9BURK
MHQPITPRRQPLRPVAGVLLNSRDAVRFIRQRGAVVQFDYACYAMRVLAGAVTKRAAYSGPAVKEKAKVVASAGGGDSTPGDGASDGTNGSDGDGGDGDGDGDSDGPRRSLPPSPSPRLPSCRSSPRAPRRQIIPKLLTRYAFAWLLALALVLGFVALPALAILAAQLGHRSLASEILHFNPVWLLPIGISASSG